MKLLPHLMKVGFLSLIILPFSRLHLEILERERSPLSSILILAVGVGSNLNGYKCGREIGKRHGLKIPDSVAIVLVCFRLPIRFEYSPIKVVDRWYSHGSI